MNTQMNTHELIHENGGVISCCGSESEGPGDTGRTSIHVTAPALPSRSFAEMVNLQELMERLDNDSELLREIFDLFCDEFPELHSHLRAAVQSGSLPCIQSKAHALKGMFANLSVTHAAAAAAEIEQMARMGDQSGLTVALARLDDEVSSLLPCVERFLTGLER